MKMLLTAFIFLLASSSFAKTRYILGSYFYRHDIFTGDMFLNLEKDNEDQTLLMDTPTPYGIRVYRYDVKKTQCTNSRLMVEAVSAWNKKVIFKYPAQDDRHGTLSYYNDLNEREAELNLKCSPDEIKKICP